LVSLAVCPNCGDRLELTFNVAAIKVQPEIEPAETYSLNVADYEVTFRLPNSQDLTTLVPHTGLDESRQQLLERCLLKIHHQDQRQPIDQTPPEVIEAVVARMGQLDPQAEVKLDLVCPGCSHQWLAAFDIVSFLWSEIDAWAYRVLNEVHLLASAYGWSEADILSLSPWRRRFYLEMVSRY
ncbi:MAG: phage baseplate protein, partial [Chloroflexota bacterium]